MQAAVIRAETIAKLEHVNRAMMVAPMAPYFEKVATVDEMLDRFGHASDIARCALPGYPARGGNKKGHAGA